MKKALLVTNSEQSAALLKQLLREEGYDDISVFFAAYSAREEDDVYDLICINAPLPDGMGIDFAAEACAESDAGVLLLINQAYPASFVPPLPAVCRLLPFTPAASGAGE